MPLKESQFFYSVSWFGLNSEINAFHHCFTVSTALDVLGILKSGFMFQIMNNMGGEDDLADLDGPEEVRISFFLLINTN